MNLPKTLYCKVEVETGEGESFLLANDQIKPLVEEDETEIGIYTLVKIETWQLNPTKV